MSLNGFIAAVGVLVTVATAAYKVGYDSGLAARKLSKGKKQRKKHKKMTASNLAR